jgi:hypothetical protein
MRIELGAEGAVSVEDSKAHGLRKFDVSAGRRHMLVVVA